MFIVTVVKKSKIVLLQKGCFAQTSFKVGVICVAFAGTRYICISFTYPLTYSLTTIVNNSELNIS